MMTPVTLAARVATQNSVFYMCDEWCLVDRCKKDPKFDITKVKDEDLPDNMKKMKPEERVKYVKDMTDKRASLNKKIADLTKERDAFLREEGKRNPNPADRAFDAAVRETLRIQAGAKGLQIKE